MASDSQLSAGGNVRNVRLEYSFKNDPIVGRKFELVVTTRTPSYNTRIPASEIPTIEEMPIIVARTMTNWKNVMQTIIFSTPLPDNRLAGIKAVRRDTDNPELSGIIESDASPYVTVWNMTNYYNPGLSVTVHSYDDGSEALAIARAHIAGIDLFEQHCEKLGFIILNKSIEGDSEIPPTPIGDNESLHRPEPTNVTRIGRNADSLPDTTQGAYTHATNAFIRSTKSGQFEGSISLEAGKTDSPNFKTQARLADKPFDAKAVQYPHGALVAYPLVGFLQVGDWNGTRYIDIPFGNGKYRQFDDSDKQYPVWKELQNKIAIADENLVPGLKIEVSADYVVLKCNSEDKQGIQLTDKNGNPVQYKAFYGFFRKENSTKGQTTKQDNAPDLSYSNDDDTDFTGQESLSQFDMPF